ncbi:MAG TPA: hypothetical protein VF613_01025 [Longimicrobium sp.]|jgi:DNA-directed RNA polymerase specialized sigma54-like protein
MTDPHVLTLSLRELQEHLRDELARNPFLAPDARTLIAIHAEVRVRDGDIWLTATVAEHRSDEYVVRLPDGRTLTVSAPVLERDNPDAPRTGA